MTQAPKIQTSVNRPQGNFLALPQKFRAFVAGYGSGKTYIGCISQCLHYYAHPGINQGYFAPSYPQIRDIFYPTMEEVAYSMGLSITIRESNKEIHFYSGSRFRGTTICRSMDRPSSIVGFKIGHALVDELDVMQADKARDAWRKIIARMRYNDQTLKNGIDVTTTPEGFKFVYEQFSKLPKEKPALQKTYGIIHASTHDNAANLPSDYISSLLDSYPEQLISAYLNGQFVNLTSGTIYHKYNRELNRSTETIQPKEPLYIGMDFNVGKMAAVVHVKRDGLPHAVDEIIDAYDTPEMIKIIQERYQEHLIYVYPDSSGKNRKSVNASVTDLSELKSAGFRVVARSTNPFVKDRINAMNAMFCNGNGERRYFINDVKCPVYASCLEQQVWDKNGEPDKKSDKDHPNDAGGYFICYDYPIVKPAHNIKVGFAH